MSIPNSHFSIDLQETVSSLLEEKKQLACKLQEQQRKIDELTALVSSKATLLLFTLNERPNSVRLDGSGWGPGLQSVFQYFNLFINNK